MARCGDITRAGCGLCAVRAACCAVLCCAVLCCAVWLCGLCGLWAVCAVCGALFPAARHTPSPPDSDRWRGVGVSGRHGAHEHPRSSFAHSPLATRWHAWLSHVRTCMYRCRGRLGCHSPTIEPARGRAFHVLRRSHQRAGTRPRSPRWRPSLRQHLRGCLPNSSPRRLPSWAAHPGPGTSSNRCCDCAVTVR